MATLRRYEARSRTELDLIDTWVHDSDSATDQIVFDAAREEVKIAFEAYPPWHEKGFPGRQLVGMGLIARRYRQPYYRCLLTVREAKGLEPEGDELSEPVGFENVYFDEDPPELFFDSMYESRFRIPIRRLDVTLEVTDEIAYSRWVLVGRGIPWEITGERIQ